MRTVYLAATSTHTLHTHTRSQELTKGLRKTGGRNDSGRITVRSRGGGHKRLYRFIDFKREIRDQVRVLFLSNFGAFQR